jgi:hypothetical protein
VLTLGHHVAGIREGEGTSSVDCTEHVVDVGVGKDDRVDLPAAGEATGVDSWAKARLPGAAIAEAAALPATPRSSERRESSGRKNRRALGFIDDRSTVPPCQGMNVAGWSAKGS